MPILRSIFAKEPEANHFRSPVDEEKHSNKSSAQILKLDP